MHLITSKKILQGTSGTKNWLHLCIPIFIIVCLSQFIYLNSLSNQFVYDDEFIITNNPFIKTWDNFPKLFSREYFEYSGELSYRPAVTATYFIDYALWKLTSFGYHFANNCLHSLNAVLVFFLLLHLFKHTGGAFAGALIFACHPVLSETVNAVCFREDLLACTFFLSSFLFYNRTKLKCSYLFYAASLACYFFGIFSKEIAITLPLLLFLCDALYRESFKKNIRYYAGYVFITIFYLAIRFIILHNPEESTVSYPGNSILVNCLTMSKVFVYYIKLFFLPTKLCSDYVIPRSFSLSEPSVITSFLMIVSVAVIVYKLFTYHKELLFSFVWFFISLLPVLNIIPIENIMAERYLYLPAVSFSMLCAGFIVSCKKTIPFSNKSYGIIILACMLILFSVKTYNRNKVWKTQSVLWESTVKTTPDSFKAHNNLGNFYRDSGKLDQAIEEFHRALNLFENYAEAHNNLGITYRKKGMYEEAYNEYQKALQLNPGYSGAHNNLGVLYTKINKTDLAIEEFKQAIANERIYPDAHNNLGVLYAHLGRLDLAIEEFRNAISDKPDYPEAYNNLGTAYLKKGMYEEAINELLKAITYNNRDIKAYYTLSTAYWNKGYYGKAAEICKKILSIDPNHQDAITLLNAINQKTGHVEVVP
ncbi:MAG: tetratricopeptide repeat protein [Planctomycetes bacterium]|nr:tetratricopeptide repeat protein [Planctomycetota bacterium]